MKSEFVSECNATLMQFWPISPELHSYIPNEIAELEKLVGDVGAKDSEHLHLSS
jgi:hypothetical protein